jgi:hypothetical protein
VRDLRSEKEKATWRSRRGQKIDQEDLSLSIP